MRIKPYSHSIIYAVIPARYASSRFPGKPLALLCGKTMIQRVVERVRRARVFRDVLVATDDARIADHVRGFGAKVVMTSPELPSGTDRVAAAMRGIRYDWVLNVQGDEPLVSPAILMQLVRRINTVAVPSIITAAHPMSLSDARSPNNVKVVIAESGRALYFSRAVIPDTSRADQCPEGAMQKHIGLYLFHRDALKAFVREKPSFLEKLEKLEQLRALETGLPIEVVRTRYQSINVDAPADVARVEALLRRSKGTR